MRAPVRGPRKAGGDDSRARSRVWAITSYFPFDDPVGVKRRLRVFREFRRHLQIPLAAIELSLSGQFDLTADDAEILVQVAEGDLMWQKERLLNRVIGELPDDCDTVAWIDCDIVFRRDDWAQRARERLADYRLLQPFGRLYHLTTSTLPDDVGIAPAGGCFDSMACRRSRGDLPDDVYRTHGSSLKLKYMPGIAWLTSRNLIQRHKLYDAAILGAGDKIIASTAYGFREDAASLYGMRRRHREHFDAWAVPFAEAVAGKVGYLEGDAYHLWHGDLQHRAYISRYEGFDAFEFDPYVDIARNAGGAWCWNSPKPDMHAFVRRVFERRREGPATPGERSRLSAFPHRAASTGV